MLVVSAMLTDFWEKGEQNVFQAQCEKNLYIISILNSFYVYRRMHRSIILCLGLEVDVVNLMRVQKLKLKYFTFLAK